MQQSNIDNDVWMNLQAAAKYLNVSYKTLLTFRSMGLEVAEIGRLRRVSKSSLDEFMKQHSF
ncbi:helix-turn-helix domain-containing protein [Lysinibacillus sphaericus]|nr:helix-turn-helix domain-containing protein [Lysinibacillus sp. SDF0037]